VHFGWDHLLSTFCLQVRCHVGMDLVLAPANIRQQYGANSSKLWSMTIRQEGVALTTLEKYLMSALATTHVLMCSLLKSLLRSAVQCESALKTGNKKAYSLLASI
jgi:hypothetical protein